MFKRNKTVNPISSDAVLFKKYKIVEICLMSAILVSGIVASIFVGLESSNPVGDMNRLYRIFIGVFAGLIIILLIFFIIYYFKIKKIIERRDNSDN